MQAVENASRNVDVGDGIAVKQDLVAGKEPNERTKREQTGTRHEPDRYPGVFLGRSGSVPAVG
jgi:hypothetical protein